MTLAGDSVLVTPGSGATIATHTVSSKEHQVVMIADDDGHILHSKDVWNYNIPSQVHVAAADTVHWDLFNADAAKLVRVVGVFQLPNIVTAVTGVAFAWNLARTTAVGTGGTVITPWAPDTSQAAMDADVTCRSKPTGGATEGTILRNYDIHSEETANATGVFAMMSTGGIANLVPPILGPLGTREGILLRQNQGLRCVQITNSAQGNTGWLICITIEG